MPQMIQALLVVAGVEQPAPPRTRGEPPYGWRAGMVFAGNYACRTPAWLLLHLHSCNSTNVEAIFQFIYPTSTQHGAFWVSGTFGATRALKLAPGGAWLGAPPPRVVPVGLLGVISDEGRRFKGEVLHGGCGSFDVNITTWDSERLGPALGRGTKHSLEGGQRGAWLAAWLAGWH